MQKTSVLGSTIASTDRASAQDATSNADQNSTSHLNSELVENGVRLVSLTHEGEDWRLGSTTPNWRNFVSSLGKNPTSEKLKELQSEGLWLAPVQNTPKLSIICGGQGAIWPHMGRDLYNTFPAARDAMDRIAALASWDVLALMDETDMEKLGRTRWQSPYIFLVSYAQACYLRSLGFQPDVYSGHSLGEIVSLALAETFSLQEAWRLFDERSALVDDLEHNGKHDTGMMAVYASAEKVEETLRNFPELLISNYNTPTQYILSGPRDVLTEARRNLRKQRFPAIILNISMAFHHPNLRVLRDYSVQELLKFDMKKPLGPVLSNATAGLYPHDKKSIVELIADLDENAVRWIDCVRTMWDDLNVRHFVELGPSDIISGLTTDIEPNAHCVSVCRKGKEVESMRRAVAELYALGHIQGPSSFAVPDDIVQHATDIEQSTEKSIDKVENTPQYVEDIMPILMEETGLERHKLAAHHDLRHDLAMRSSRFPLIIHKLETTFNIQINFEDLMHVSTVGDLAQVVADFRSSTEHSRENVKQESRGAGKKDDIHSLIVDKSSIKENMQAYPHVHPLGLTADTSPSFYAKRNFSIYSDVLLQCQQSAEPVVTEAMMLEALYASSGLGFSNFNCYGADNIGFAEPFTCAGGITREGLICVEPVEQDKLDNEKSLMCNASLYVHDLTANGRKKQDKLRMAWANVLLTKNNCSLNSIWQEDTQNLIERGVIKEYIVPIKTIAPQWHSRYSLLPLSVMAIQQVIVPGNEGFNIINISKLRHVVELPHVDALRMVWKLQSFGLSYTADVEMYSEDNLILTMQGVAISNKTRS